MVGLDRAIAEVHKDEQVVHGDDLLAEAHAEYGVAEEDEGHIPGYVFGGPAPLDQPLDDEAEVEGRAPEVGGLEAHGRVPQPPDKIHELLIMSDGRFLRLEQPGEVVQGALLLARAQGGLLDAGPPAGQQRQHQGRAAVRVQQRVAPVAGQALVLPENLALLLHSRNEAGQRLGLVTVPTAQDRVQLEQPVLGVPLLDQVERVRAEDAIELFLDCQELLPQKEFLHGLGEEVQQGLEEALVMARVALRVAQQQLSVMAVDQLQLLVDVRQLAAQDADAPPLPLLDDALQHCVLVLYAHHLEQVLVQALQQPRAQLRLAEHHQHPRDLDYQRGVRPLLLYRLVQTHARHFKILLHALITCPFRITLNCLPWLFARGHRGLGLAAR